MLQKLWKAESSFREQLIGRTQIFGIFPRSKLVWPVEGCQSMSRTWKYEESLSMKLPTFWDCICVSFEQSQRQYEHTLGCHEIHTLPAEWRAEAEVCQRMPGPFWPSLLTTFSICDFLLFPEFKTALQGRIFNNITIFTHNTGCTSSASNSALHKMLCPVALSQGSVYEVPRRLRRRYVVMLK